MSTPDARPSCLYLYADVLGYRERLAESGVDAFHATMMSVFKDVDDAVRAEPGSAGGADVYQSFAAFDTIIVFRHPIVSGEVTWALVDSFCYFASLIYLRLFVQHDILIRGAIGATQDYRIDDRVITIAEIDRMFKLEKAQESATVVLDLHGPLHGSVTTAMADEDPYLWYELPFKNKAVPEGVPSLPIGKENKQAVLRLLNPRTVKFLHDNGLSFLAAVRRLERKAKIRGLQDDVRAKLQNTLAFIKSDIEHYNTQKNPVVKRIRQKLKEPQWRAIP